MDLRIETKWGEMVQSVDNDAIERMLDRTGKNIAYCLFENARAWEAGNENQAYYWFGRAESLRLFLSSVIGFDNVDYIINWPDGGEYSRGGVRIYGVPYYAKDWERPFDDKPVELRIKGVKGEV